MTREEEPIGEVEKNVLVYLDEFTQRDGEMCTYLRCIAKKLNLSVEEVRKACRSLKRRGLAEFYRGLMNDYGEVAGSGYCITYEGQAFVHPCDKCQELAEYDWWDDSKGEMAFLEEKRVKHYKLCSNHYLEHKKSNL